MAGYQASNTMPKIGHVTDLREQWLVRTDGALAHRMQDREINSHLCENRYRNQQIREDYPLALNEQKDLEQEAYLRDVARRRQADIDAEIAREMAEINLRKQRRRQSSELLQQPGPSRAFPLEATRPLPPEPSRALPNPDNTCPPEPIRPSSDEIDAQILGLSPYELEEMRRRLEQEERDARLARQLSDQVDDQDLLLADMRFAVEAQDGELARLLQEREYKKLQRAKERARQKALIKKQQRLLSQQHSIEESVPTQTPQATLLDAYSNPRDLIRDQGNLRASKSVDSDLNYVEPFEKEHIQSKASALQSKKLSRQWCLQNNPTRPSEDCNLNTNNNVFINSSMQYRNPPPLPANVKKPKFPDPVSIRPASHYATDEDDTSLNLSNDIDNNNYSTTFPPDHNTTSTHLSLQGQSNNNSKRLSVISDITADALIKKRNKQEGKKKKGCKIQ